MIYYVMYLIGWARGLIWRAPDVAKAQPFTTSTSTRTSPIEIGAAYLDTRELGYTTLHFFTLLRKRGLLRRLLTITPLGDNHATRRRASRFEYPHTPAFKTDIYTINNRDNIPSRSHGFDTTRGDER